MIFPASLIVLFLDHLFIETVHSKSTLIGQWFGDRGSLCLPAAACSSIYPMATPCTSLTMDLCAVCYQSFSQIVQLDMLGFTSSASPYTVYRSTTGCGWVPSCKSGPCVVCSPDRSAKVLWRKRTTPLNLDFSKVLKRLAGHIVDHWNSLPPWRSLSRTHPLP